MNKLTVIILCLILVCIIYFEINKNIVDGYKYNGVYMIHDSDSSYIDDIIESKSDSNFILSVCKKDTVKLNCKLTDQYHFIVDTSIMRINYDSCYNDVKLYGKGRFTRGRSSYVNIILDVKVIR